MRIMVQRQPRQIVPQDLILKTLHKNRADGVVQGEGPEFKPQYCKREREGGRDRGRERESKRERELLKYKSEGGCLSPAMLASLIIVTSVCLVHCITKIGLNKAV
jgi:hypothetical protein